jgi:hypothetical protein
VQALKGNTGNDNIAIGQQAGYDVSSGNENILIGYQATGGTGITSGSGNILIGKDLRLLAQTGSNQLDIGNLIFGTGLNSNTTLSTGSVGIGTASPISGTTLEVYGDVDVKASSHINFGTTDGSGGYGFNDSSGTLQFKNSGGSWAAFQAASDRRLKRDIVDLSENDGLAAILKLHPVRFHWKDAQQDKDEGEQIGLIAQDVEKVFPVGVTGNYGDAVVHLGNGTKETVQHAWKLDYGRLVSPIIKAIQQLSGRFEQPSGRLEQLVSDPVVGSVGHPAGITLYDDVTGEPYCARMHAGELVHAKGACAGAAGRTAVVAPPSTDKSDGQ